VDTGFACGETSVICSVSLISVFDILVIPNIQEHACLKQHVGFTIDSKLLSEIEALRGREKRSTFIEHLIRLGLRVYREVDA
jgi:hypothetical protein